MREVLFIKQNKPKWLEFEKAIYGNSKKTPDELAGLYIQLMNDLSYAQTYYPKSKTITYINHLAVQTYQKIYKTKRHDSNRLIYFFKEEVPQLVYEYRKAIVFAFVVFAIFTAMGVVSAHYDKSFVRFILGDEYVNLTQENIKKGNPVAIYKSGSNWGSFIGITINNLFVGMMSYIRGIFIGIGTLYSMLQNCIMLGAFQYMFVHEGVFWESVRGIWIHGSMEIFAMTIEAGAGFALGASILFPRTLSRIESFKKGAIDTFKIFISTMPFTVAAGFLEGFITRYSIDMPHWLSVTIILVTLSIISYYYLIYPFIINKKNNRRNVSII